MIFEDSNALQQQLFRDLDSLLRIIKSEQQSYLEINDVLATIFQNKQQIETNLFVDHDVANYRLLVKNAQLKEQGCGYQKRCIVEKYQKVDEVQQNVVVLLRRLVYRVLEMVFSSINQLTLKPVNSYQQYIRFKLVCQKLLAQINVQKPFKILKCISDYTTNKLHKSLVSLSVVASNLENGKVQEIDKLKLSSALNKLPQKEMSIKTNKSHFLQNCYKIKYKIKENSPFFKQQARNGEKGAFLLQRRAKRAMDNIKDVMEINRQEFVQDFIGSCHQSNKQKLLRGLMTKNKFNQKQISEFLTKKNHYKRKMSSQLQQEQPKAQVVEQSSNQEALIGDDLNQTSYRTTRKSLLLKINNEHNQGTITSQFYRKITKLQEYRLKLRSSHLEIKKAPVQNVGIYKTIEEIITQNQELTIKAREQDGSSKERLPLLNKRALSVDQNHKTEDLGAGTYTKGLCNSMKLAESCKKKKGEKAEMLPSKIKIELKTLNNLICSEINKKLAKYDHFNRKLCF